MNANRLWPYAASIGMLLWPAVWNGFPIVFADTGTYLSQAIHRYIGWDRPPFYSLFMLPLHGTVTLWPVVVAQAWIVVWTVHRVCLALMPDFDGRWLPAVFLPVATCTWLPFLVCQLMPDFLTPLLVLLLCLIGAEAAKRSAVFWAALAMAAQQSSLLMADPLILLLLTLRRSRRLLVAPFLAVTALLAINFAGHGRLAISPFGNVFLLARVIYDGPGAEALRRECPGAGWRLCPWTDRLPPTSDDFLWRADSPIVLAGGHKAVSKEADAILAAALVAAPADEMRAFLRNSWEQLQRFDSGDGLEAWPNEVSPWIKRDFPAATYRSYQASLQSRDLLRMPDPLGAIHWWVAVGGVVACVLLLPIALWRRHPAWVYVLTTLIALPLGAAITGGLSTPHDRYQSRLMCLPPLVAGLAAVAMARRPS